MKRAAFGHTKIRKLCRLLGLREYAAVGVLECLWNLAARETPRGDIGHLSDEDIALALDWDREPAELIGALVACRLLDESVDHRLIVHDWSEHADDALHTALARRGEYFADGQAPRTMRLTGRDRERAQALYGANGAHAHDLSPDATPTELMRMGSRTVQTHAHGVEDGPDSCASRARAQPCLALPEPKPEPEPRPGTSHTPAAEAMDPPPPQAAARRVRVNGGASPGGKPEGGKPEGGKPADEWERLWQEFRGVYPPRDGDLGVSPGSKLFLRLLRGGADPAAILDGAERYRAWADASGNSGTRWIKQIPTWLDERGWEEPWNVRDRGSPALPGAAGAAPVPLEVRRDTILAEVARLQG